MNIDLSKYKLVKPESITRNECIKKFYDIEVEDNHTFYIVGENNNILTHNCDGNSIAALLLNFFYKYWPEIFELNLIYKIETPILVAIDRKTKVKTMFYSQEEYKKWENKNKLSNFEIKYKKGLGALTDDEYEKIINNPKLMLITKDDISKTSLEIWFGKNADLRKNELLKDE